MDDIPILLKLEYNEYRRILYEDLIFEGIGYTSVHTYMLKDSPEVEIVGWDFI